MEESRRRRSDDEDSGNEVEPEHRHLTSSSSRQHIYVRIHLEYTDFYENMFLSEIFLILIYSSMLYIATCYAPVHCDLERCLYMC